jgi:predicted enzyme related to lactoylglutathione lyase
MYFYTVKLKIIFLIGLSAFVLGFAANELVHRNHEPRVTGLGGVFFKSKDPKSLKEWYSKHLGIHTNAYGAVFEWHQGGDSTQKGFTQWSPFKETTTYFQPSDKPFMINYRVVGLDQLLLRFNQNNVRVLDSIQRYDYGNFLHILDPEGNKIELWEPNDAAYEKMGLDMGLKTIF